MCISVFSIGQSPRYPFVLVSNRDEILNRPSSPARFHGSKESILSGLDLEKGGTWLGITKSGRFAMVTNYRDPSLVKDLVHSRGELVLDFLNSAISPPAYFSKIESKFELYNGYNLVIGDLKTQSFWYVSNVLKSLVKLEPGLYGISNAFLDTPWPKTTFLKEGLQVMIQNERMELDDWESLVLDSKTYPMEVLPNTGVKPELEQALSSVFISLPSYGTLCSTLIRVDQYGIVTFRELLHNHDNSTFARNQFQFSIE